MPTRIVVETLLQEAIRTRDGHYSIATADAATAAVDRLESMGYRIIEPVAMADAVADALGSMWLGKGGPSTRERLMILSVLNAKLDG